MRVLKFPIPVGDRVRVQMRPDARIVHVGMQGETPVMWAETKPPVSLDVRTFNVFVTGEAIPAGWSYVGTAETSGFPFVAHIYEETP
jgi:hypothetical protein